MIFSVKLMILNSVFDVELIGRIKNKKNWGLNKKIEWSKTG